MTLARISHKLSTALRYVGAGGDFPGFGTLQGVDPASPPNLHETPASTRPPFARHEFCEICGLVIQLKAPGQKYCKFCLDGRMLRLVNQVVVTITIHFLVVQFITA